MTDFWLRSNLYPRHSLRSHGPGATRVMLNKLCICADSYRQSKSALLTFGARHSIPLFREKSGTGCHGFCPVKAGFGPAERDVLTSLVNFAEVAGVYPAKRDSGLLAKVPLPLAPLTGCPVGSPDVHFIQSGQDRVTLTKLYRLAVGGNFNPIEKSSFLVATQ